MRKLHRSGELDPRIVSYRSRLAVEQIIDPAPVVSQDILQVSITVKAIGRDSNPQLVTIRALHLQQQQNLHSNHRSA
ncbi:Hypothetical protein PHPALM_3777 [Phytophthora palmivora]|uniref:Uncharacterized protein n=1 Tax=Phytophthora palmivora TaxID=4796 RepID=A0A2P4YLI6_9STRA|nr:Hypothetical protein PHPALM_3777 [Phytophthora palmivora]